MKPDEPLTPVERFDTHIQRSPGGDFIVAEPSSDGAWVHAEAHIKRVDELDDLVREALDMVVLLGGEDTAGYANIVKKLGTLT